MPFTRLALILCYVLSAAALTVFLLAQLQPQGPDAGRGASMILPLVMLAGLAIRSLQKRHDRDDP